MKPMRPTVGSSSSSAMTSAASVDDTSRSSWEEDTSGRHGTRTAPTFRVPRTISSQSTVVPETTITRSPGFTFASRSVVGCVAMNGSAAIHDFELALIGGFIRLMARAAAWLKSQGLNVVMSGPADRTATVGRRARSTATRSPLCLSSGSG